MSLIIIGTYVPGESSRWFFLAGTSTLGVTAILGRSRFYAALQLPIIIGAFIPFLPSQLRLGGVAAMSLMVMGSVAYLGARHELVDWQAKVGASGLILLALGFASGVKTALLPANLTLLFNAVYRLRVRQEKIAVVWLALEMLATGGTLFSLVCG